MESGCVIAVVSVSRVKRDVADMLLQELFISETVESRIE